MMLSELSAEGLDYRPHFSFSHFDWWLFIPMVLIVSYGVVVISSFSWVAVQQQLAFAGLGLVLYLGLMRMDYRLWKSLAPIVYGGVCALLLATALTGTAQRGSVRWLTVGGFTFQPSELGKLVVVIGLASLLTQPFFRRWDLMALLVSIALVLIPAGLVYAQPDLGTALLLVIILGWVVWVAGINTLYLGILVSGGLLLLIPFWFYLQDYQQERVLTFFNPMRDPLGAGYHVLQSKIAAGSGIWFGRGYGQGTQTHLQFLPDFQTDFIFSALAEEWGFVGAILLLLLFGVLFCRLISVARQARDDFGTLLVSGVFAMLFFQTLVNVGMNLGLMPVTGIPLPLVSVGGSSMVTTLMALGLVQSVSLRRQ